MNPQVLWYNSSRGMFWPPNSIIRSKSLYDRYITAVNFHPPRLKDLLSNPRASYAWRCLVKCWSFHGREKMMSGLSIDSKIPFTDCTALFGVNSREFLLFQLLSFFFFFSGRFSCGRHRICAKVCVSEKQGKIRRLRGWS